MEYFDKHFVVDHIEIFNGSDLKWLVMLMGMTDMSSIRCVYCILRKKDWMGDGHDLSEDLLRTIVKNLELGEKAATHEKLLNYIIPLLHIMTGVFNDIINHSMKIMELENIKLPQEEMTLHDDIAAVDAQVKELGNAATEWKISTEGSK